MEIIMFTAQLMMGFVPNASDQLTTHQKKVQSYSLCSTFIFWRYCVRS